MYKKRVSVVITDLDNTLFDWVEIWYRPFKAMIDKVLDHTGISQEILLSEIKVIHEKHGTSEYSTLLEEIPSLQKFFAGKDIAIELQEAIREYRKTRKSILRLYPGVMNTLRTLKEYGCLIIGYTESMEFYSNYRIRNLGLDGVLDIIYYPPDHAIPQNIDRNQLRFYPNEYYELKETKHKLTPRGQLKPNRDLLNAIIDEIKAKKDETIYIGDSLMKDIQMAQSAQVADVYAKYGVAQERKEYELLRQVTHWSINHVEKEKQICTNDVIPSYTLENSFSEILALFKFIPYGSSQEYPSDPYINHRVEAWKKTVDIQQHFNDLELRIRSYAVTLLSAFLTVAAYSLKEHLVIALFGKNIPVAAALTIIALLMWSAFYIMDRLWYHRLLIGAVKHGESIEERLKFLVPEITLTTTISKASPVRIGRLRKFLHSKNKMDLFYFLVAIGLGIITLLILLGGISPPLKEQGSQTTTQASQEQVESATLSDPTKHETTIPHPPSDSIMN